MLAMIDARCDKCGKRFGWAGALTDRPPCPRCGDRPDATKLAADQAHFDEMERLLLLRPRDAKGDELRQQRKLAGLDLGHVAKALGVAAATVSGWERGIERPTDEQAAALAELYGVGE